MQRIIHQILEDRLKGIGSLFLRSLPFHFLILALFWTLRYGMTKIPISESLMQQIGMGMRNTLSGLGTTSFKIKLILILFMLLQTALYTLFTTIHYRINEMTAKKSSFDFNFIFNSFLSRFTKSLVYNIVFVIIIGGLLYLIVLTGIQTRMIIGLKSVAYFFTSFTLLIALILFYIRQMLCLPDIAQNNAGIWSAFKLSFKNIKTKHAILALFISIAVLFIFFVVMAILAGALIELDMPNFQQLFAFPWYKLIPIYILYVAFYIFFYVTRSAILFFVKEDKETASIQYNSTIIDHISEEI